MNDDRAAHRFAPLLARQRRALALQCVHIALVGAVVLFAAWQVDLLNGARLSRGVPDLFDLLGEMVPPNFANWRGWILPVVDTLMMSIAGTALAVGLSLPLAFLAARTTTPHPLAYHASRAVLNITRAVPELILGIILVAAVGFGALPGTLALGLHSVGMVGKFFAESIERAEPEPIEAVTAAGCSRLQILAHGILPQALPSMADVTLYRWEYNFRASTVLGAVGAGGIGFQLIASLRVLKYDEMFAIILVVLLMVTAVDTLGALLRQAFK